MALPRQAKSNVSDTCEYEESSSPLGFGFIGASRSCLADEGGRGAHDEGAEASAYAGTHHRSGIGTRTSASACRDVGVMDSPVF